MQPTIDEIAESVREGEPGSAWLQPDELGTLYYSVRKSVGVDDLLLTVIRLDELVALQFSQYSKFRVHIKDEKQAINRGFIEQSVPQERIEYIDVRGHRESFLGFLGHEIADNRVLLGLISVVFSCGLFWLGSRDGVASLFNLTSQVVSIFVAVFVAYTALQSPRVTLDIRLFERGHLSDYHRADRHLAQLAVIAIFASLFGTMISKKTMVLSVPQPGGSAPILLDLSPWLLGAIAIALLAILGILFLSLTEYYLELKKRTLFSELQRELLDEKAELHRRADPKVVPFQPNGDRGEYP